MNIYDIAIIGSGPAGLTAGIYAGRASRKTIIIEGNMPGGQLMTTTWVENWPGEVKILGPDVMKRMREHAQHYGAELLGDTVTDVSFTQAPYAITTQTSGVIHARSVIIATGSSHKKLGVPGEAEYWGKGITTCATCDAPFYRDREVVIAGGGNTAMTEAAFLSNFAKKITVVQLLDHITATDPIKNSVFNDPKVTILTSSKIVEVTGSNGQINGVLVENTQTGIRTTIPTDGLFIAIGFSPNTGLFKGQLEIDQYGYLALKGHTQTSQPGVFACGDVSDYIYRQAITSAGMGCMAALDADSYLRSIH